MLEPAAWHLVRWLWVGIGSWMGLGYFLSFRGRRMPRLWPSSWSWSAQKFPTTEWPVGKVYPVLQAELKVQTQGKVEGEEEDAEDGQPSPSPPPSLRNVLQVVFAKEGRTSAGRFLSGRSSLTNRSCCRGRVCRAWWSGGTSSGAVTM